MKYPLEGQGDQACQTLTALYRKQQWSPVPVLSFQFIQHFGEGEKFCSPVTLEKTGLWGPVAWGRTRVESSLQDVTPGEAEGHEQDGRGASGMLWTCQPLGEDLRKQTVCKTVAGLVEKPMHRSKLKGRRSPRRHWRAVFSRRKQPRQAANLLDLGMLHAGHVGFDLQMAGLDFYPLPEHTLTNSTLPKYLSCGRVWWGLVFFCFLNLLGDFCFA